MTQNHDIHSSHEFWLKKFNFRSEIQKEFKNVILKLSETEAKNYWVKFDNGIERETEPWEKRRFLEQKMLEQQKKEQEEELRRQKIEEERAAQEKAKDPVEQRKTQLLIWATGYGITGERFFTKERQAEMKKMGIDEAEIRDAAKGYRQKELATR